MIGIQDISSSTDDEPVYAAGLRLSSLLSVAIFRQEFGVENVGAPISHRFHDCWTDFADALAASPTPLEILSVLSSASQTDSLNHHLTCNYSLLVLGRGDDHETARRACAESLRNVRVLVDTVLGFAQFRDLPPGELTDLLLLLSAPVVAEARRRREVFGVISDTRGPLGFLVPQEATDEVGPEAVTHLFPWVPSDDSWARLTSVLREEGGPRALVVHAQGFGAAPREALAMTHAELQTIETALARIEAGRDLPFLVGQLAALRADGSSRFAALYHRVLALRVFLAGATPPSSALVATLAGSIDDPSAYAGAMHDGTVFRGGVRIVPSDKSQIWAGLDSPSADILFTAREATAALRTPMPTTSEIPGFPLIEARTLRLNGVSGGDVALGLNIHRADSQPVRFSEEMRFRHTYVVGQTGTGKSTFLLNMLLEDAAKGRGVCLLDPHGSMVDDVLRNLPASRRDDVVLLDVTDTDHPVGFNPLHILETDPQRYMLERDVVVDGLLSYLMQTYRDVKEAFGPVFESHFRAMMSLLLGVEPPDPLQIPNLTMFRSLYSDSGLRNALIRGLDGRDTVLVEMIDEAMKVDGEGALANVAPYITSKFARFIADKALRNVICQRSTLDMDAIVEGQKILLVHLGRGRLGNLPAGLLASQVVAAIGRSMTGVGHGKRRPPFYVYADEFQLFADVRFAEWLAEARKFGLSLTLAHQHLDQLPKDVQSAVLGNCGTVVTFRVGANDARELAGLFSPLLAPHDLLSLPNYCAYVRGSGGFGQLPFSITGSPPPVSGDDAAADEIRRVSRERYGKPREEVEREMTETAREYQKLVGAAMKKKIANAVV